MQRTGIFYSLLKISSTLFIHLFRQNGWVNFSQKPVKIPILYLISRAPWRITTATSPSQRVARWRRSPSYPGEAAMLPFLLPRGGGGGPLGAGPAPWSSRHAGVNDLRARRRRRQVPARAAAPFLLLPFPLPRRTGQPSCWAMHFEYS